MRSVQRIGKARDAIHDICTTLMGVVAVTVTSGFGTSWSASSTIHADDLLGLICGRSDISSSFSTTTGARFCLLPAIGRLAGPVIVRLL